jgi:hypothetical protein
MLGCGIFQRAGVGVMTKKSKEETAIERERKGRQSEKGQKKRVKERGERMAERKKLRKRPSALYGSFCADTLNPIKNSLKAVSRYNIQERHNRKDKLLAAN